MMSRKEALEIAQECIKREMKDAYNEMMLANASAYRDQAYKDKRTARYAKLTAALQVIENMARQRELL